MKQDRIGVVRWFSRDKCFGFIRRECDGRDLFVHKSALQVNGLESLEAGQYVTFDVAENAKGLRAENVSLLR